MPAYRNILICIPSVSQSVKSGTAIAVAEATKALQLAGANVDFHNIDSAEIVTARDMFANMLLHDAHWEALLFVDSDMAFQPSLVNRIVAHGGDVVAAACPRRTFNLDRFLASSSAHGDRRRAIAEASDFTVNHSWPNQVMQPTEIREGFSTAAAVGMACALISKKALQAMVQEGAVEPRDDLHTRSGATCYSFFKPVEADGQRYGEDYSFCYRWTAMMKRKLWVCVDEDVTHIGHYNYVARYADLVGNR